MRTGLFGLNESLFPLQDADLRDDRVVVPFEKATVKDAPNVDADHDEPLTQAEVDRLYQHYGTTWDDAYRSYQAGAAAADSSYTGAGTASDGAGLSGDDAMTRSEERLNVGTQREQVGRARLRKYVVTEQQQVSVPVSREEVRPEREPITDDDRDAAYSGADLTESEHEVTLHAERPVVDTEAVPVERVRLGKESVTEQQTVGGEVRKERIEADLPDEDGRRTFS
ncbi:hypothetical protein Acy02nite_81850 [Actinoplanes cyaneus]|uniref:DUF2382 domain-containing protein n=1 Tax=Actinoplanes cyaneus TaxID=52696 RepID=A0A919IQF6_9ACTN|nr:conserved domain-containing protein [Actinoplanes cyaneus]GID70304.1 hypothetical protein Acy02nite_81850 [Actinoplanes cyaneus]